MHDPISGNALITIVLKEKLLYYLKYCIVLLPRSPRWGGGGGNSAYERGGDARRKLWIKPLKETDLGVAQAFFDP